MAVIDPIKRIYVATQWANREKARGVMRYLRNSGKLVVYDWTHTDADEYQHSDKLRSSVSQEELDAIDRCDALVLLMPGGRGSMIEFGYALAKGKFTVVVGEPGDMNADGYTTGLLERASRVVTPTEFFAGYMTR